MRTIELSSGVRVGYFTVPGPDFDPSRGDDRVLAVHGVPKRPAHPAAGAQWDRIVRRRPKLLQPQFATAEHVRHGRAERVTNDPHSSTNWAGVIARAPADDPFSWVSAQWTVPSAVAPDSASGFETCHTASWVGLDGDGSDSILQAGVATVAVWANGVSYPTTPFAWFEWFPGAETRVTNLPVRAGDLVSVTVCLVDDTNAKAFIAFTNLTLNLAASFHVEPKSRAHAVPGRTAEWIVEAPKVGGAPSTLTNFGAVIFDDTMAGTRSGNDVFHAAEGHAVKLVDREGNRASATLEAPRTLRCSFDGRVSGS